MLTADIHSESSSEDREYIWQASDSVNKPAATALTTAALRLATQRTVFSGGRSARVMVVPSGNFTDRGPGSFFRNIIIPLFAVREGSTEGLKRG